MEQTTDFYLTGIPAADALLQADPNALLIGMVLDQQVTMEKAFAGPAVIAERMGGRLDVAAIADADPEQFAAICSRPPAIRSRINEMKESGRDPSGEEWSRLFDSVFQDGDRLHRAADRARRR